LLPIPNKGTSEWSYSWIPVVGPIAGAAIGAAIYNAAF
jgi:glycerol uptake facilitator protein